MGVPPIGSAVRPRIAHAIAVGLGRLRARPLEWFRHRGRPKEPVPILRMPAEPPSVVLACERCGFDYTVSRLEVGAEKKALLWTCDCGTRFIPPGGVPSFQLLRP